MTKHTRILIQKKKKKTRFRYDSTTGLCFRLCRTRVVYNNIVYKGIKRRLWKRGRAHKYVNRSQMMLLLLKYDKNNEKLTARAVECGGGRPLKNGRAAVRNNILSSTIFVQRVYYIRILFLFYFFHTFNSGFFTVRTYTDDEWERFFCSPLPRSEINLVDNEKLVPVCETRTRSRRSARTSYGN